MVDYSKRKFLLASSAGLVASPFAYSQLFEKINVEATSKDNIAAEVSNEIEAIRSQWQKHETITAQQFLENTGINPYLRQPKIKAIISQDFMNNQTLMVKGMLLSKTEAALLICLA